MPATIQDFIFTNAGLAGQFVQLRSNQTGIAYTSAVASTATGSFVIPGGAPPGYYSLYVSPTLVGPTWTLYDSFFFVGPDVGDTLYLGMPVASTGPRVDITHPTYAGHNDFRQVVDGAMTATQTTLSSNTAVFVNATIAAGGDIGKIVGVLGAGVAGAVLQATIISVQSATACTLSLAASTTVAGATVGIGTDNGPALVAAYTYLVGIGGGTITGPAGGYAIRGAFAINSILISLDFPGSSRTKFWYMGAADCFRVQMNPFTTTQAGKLFGFTGDGTFAASGSAGLHYGDTIGGQIDDIVMQNFVGGNQAVPATASKGYWIDNRTNWTERTQWGRCWESNNTIGVLFDVNGGTNSWGYQDFFMFVNVNNNQTGVLLNANGAFYSGSFRLRGNSAGNNAIIWQLLGTSSMGAGSGATFIDVAVEGDGGVPTGLSLGATNTIAGFGKIDLSLGGVTSVRAAGSGFYFAGYLQGAGLIAGSAGVPLYSSADTNINSFFDTPSGVNKRTRAQFAARGVNQFSLLVDRNVNGTRDFSLFDDVNAWLAWIVDASGNFLLPKGGLQLSNFGVGSAQSLWAGFGVPANGSGANGDFYFNTNGGRLHFKTGGVWVDISTLFTSLAVSKDFRRSVQTPTEAILVSGVDATAGEMIEVTLTANRVVGLPLNPATGQELTFTLIQSGAGAFTVGWNAGFKQSWSDVGNASPKRSTIVYWYDGTNWNQKSAQTPYV